MKATRSIILMLVLTCPVWAGAQDGQDAVKEAGDAAALPEIQGRGQAVELLGHEDYAVREHAQTYLLRDDTIDRQVLRELLLNSKNLEQRQRLIQIAEHHIMRIVREELFGAGNDGDARFHPASVGFSYNALLADENPLANRIGLIVKATMPGFPAFAYLKPGDLIVGVDGQAVPSFTGITQWLSERISRYQAGDTMRFTVVRNGKTINLTLVCAQRTALNQMYDTDAVNAASRSEAFNRIWAKAYEQLTRDLPGPAILKADK